MLLRFLAIVVVSLSLSACGMYVKTSVYNEALQKIHGLETERDGLSAKATELTNKAAELEENLGKSTKQVAELTESNKALQQDKAASDEKLKAIAQELEDRKAEIVKLNQDIENVRISKDKEIAEIKARVKDISVRAEVLVEKIKGILKENKPAQ